MLDEDDEAQEIIEEDELNLLQKLKELKKEYRETFSQLKEIKNQVSLIQQSID